MKIYIVIQPDNKILGVKFTGATALRAAQDHENFWGWIEIWKLTRRGFVFAESVEFEPFTGKPYEDELPKLGMAQ